MADRLADAVDNPALLTEQERADIADGLRTAADRAEHAITQTYLRVVAALLVVDPTSLSLQRVLPYAVRRAGQILAVTA